MNKLTYFESQRVLSVLEESLENIQLISLVTRDVLNSPPEDLVKLLSKELYAALIAQKEWENNYNELASEVKYKKAESVHRDNPEHVEEAMKNLRRSTITVCKMLKDPINAPVVDKLKFLQNSSRTKPIGGWKTLTKGYTDLLELQSKRFFTTVEEERSRRELLGDIQAKEQKATKDLRNAQNELSDIRGRQDKEATLRNNTIAKLKDEIQDIKDAASSEGKTVKQEIHLNETKDLQDHEEKASGQKDTHTKLQTELDELIKTNKKNELGLRKKKYKSEKEVENWISKYDEDMHQKENEKRGLTTECEALSRDLQEVEQVYAKLMQERETMLAEERKLNDEHMAEAERVWRLNHAASVIQRRWRGFLKRKLLDRKFAQKRPQAKTKLRPLKQQQSPSRPTTAQVNSQRTNKTDTNRPSANTTRPTSVK